jgi:FkbM family methyltransferase
MELDKGDTMRLSTRGYYEPVLTKIIENQVKEGDTVFDIGAHIGYYTLKLARKVGPSGKVYAFEAHPDNYAILKRNVEANGYKNVHICNKAVSDSNGRIKLFFGKERSAHHSTLKNEYCNDEGTEIDSVRLDDFLSPFIGEEKVNFIKIDIEGGEFKALRGMENLIKRSDKLRIVTEIVPSFLEKQDLTVDSYIRYLESLGIELYYIDEDSGKIDKLNLKEFIFLCNRREKINFNLLGIKRR